MTQRTARTILGAGLLAGVLGLAYGVAVYLLMNLVEVPLSAVPPRPFVPSLAMLVVHMVCVGLPIAIVLRHREA